MSLRLQLLQVARSIAKLGATVLLLAGIGLGVLLLVLAGLLYLLNASTIPATPKDRFVGDWKPHQEWQVLETRPLPPAHLVQTEFANWNPNGDVNTNRLYVARLGGADRQSNFEVSITRGDTPLGAQDFTFASFNYHDSSNGLYRLTWSLRGKHKPDFLKFDGRMRHFYLQPYGLDDESGPKLKIVAIEGVSPFDR